MGGKLGTIFARAGHEVIFSYARRREKLERLARQAGNDARASTPHEAARADAVLLAVNWWRLNDVLKQAGSLSGKVVISCSLPMKRDNSDLVIAHKSSGAEALAKKIPRARVVFAFSTVPSDVVFDVAWSGTKTPPSLVYCGDDRKAKNVAARLIRDAGFDPLDAGPLKLARYMEPATLLIAQLAYEGKGGPRLAYRFERFKGR
jgi:predicted dinucleotide-binding enzyme